MTCAQVQAGAVQAVRAQVADVIVAEGVGAATGAAGQLSRDQVRAEAVQARDTPQRVVSEGLVHLF